MTCRRASYKKREKEGDKTFLTAKLCSSLEAREPGSAGSGSVAGAMSASAAQESYAADLNRRKAEEEEKRNLRLKNFRDTDYVLSLLHP